MPFFFNKSKPKDFKENFYQFYQSVIFFLPDTCLLDQCRYVNCRLPIAGSWNTIICLRAFSIRLATRTFVEAVAIAPLLSRTNLPAFLKQMYCQFN